MIKKLILTACLLIACGGEPPVVDLPGIEYPPDLELIEYARDQAEQGWAEIFEPFEVPETNVHLVSAEHDELKSIGVTYLAEVPPEIYIYYQAEKDYDTCYWPRIVLAHEYLHVLCFVTETGSRGANHFHVTDEVWVIWAKFEEIDIKESIEGRIQDRTKSYCSDRW